VETEAMRNSANKRSTLWSISWSMRRKTASSVLMADSLQELRRTGKLAMLSYAEKRHRSVQTFEFAVGSQGETEDLRYQTEFFHFLFRISKA
jgi:hypothetical protein